jgi:hypothetical protein
MPPVDIYNRLVRGKVTSIDIKRNTCRVLIHDKTGEFTCFLGHPFISSSSGIRFAPQGGETVLVNFSATGVPTIVGFILEPKRIEEQEANKEEVYFREIKPGELVLYGGAGDSELYIDNQGKIEMGAGVNVVSLDPFRRVLEFVTGSMSGMTLNGAKIDLGNVARDIAGQTQIIPEAVEFRAQVETKDLSVVDIKFGNVISNLGIPDVSSRLIPKVFSLATYAGILKIGEIYVDKLGLVEATSTNQLSIDAPLIQLGGNLALNSLVKGEILISQIGQLISILNRAFGAFEIKPGFESIVTGLLGEMSALLGQLPSALSPTVRVK